MVVKAPANTYQAGIFALGTASHAYLEFDDEGGAEGAALVAAIAGLREPRTTMGGVNLVAGFRPELWRSVAQGGLPEDVVGFTAPIVGAGGFTMPATQHDAVLWISGSAYDVVFDVARQAIGAVRGIASLAEETSSWPYHHDRDLTGFIDGSENPTLVEAPEVALIPEPGPGASGSILLLQKWSHDATEWESLPVARQESIIGRAKLDSEELKNKPADSHVARNDQDAFGKIFRRNMPYGTVTDHGTMFVGFSSEQRRLVAMLESMAGVHDGVRDALTYFTMPLTGAYYFVPSLAALRAVAPDS
jgi:porphyrinogen peroxidase